MTRAELISLLRVAESALWDAASKAPETMDAHQRIALALRAVDSEEQCPQCGNPLVQPAVGRPKRYCGDNCRKAAYAARHRG
jgi:hypothetical protein